METRAAFAEAQCERVCVCVCMCGGGGGGEGVGCGEVGPKALLSQSPPHDPVTLLG